MTLCNEILLLHSYTKLIKCPVIIYIYSRQWCQFVSICVKNDVVHNKDDIPIRAPLGFMCFVIVNRQIKMKHLFQFIKKILNLFFI